MQQQIRIKKSQSEPGSRLGMPVSRWPMLDQKLWTAAVQPVDLLDLQSTSADMRDSTGESLVNAYARWLLWVKQHEPAALELPPSERATQDRMVAYLRDLQKEVTVRTMYNYAWRLKKVLSLLAPDLLLDWLTPMGRRMERQARGTALARRPYVPSEQLFAYGIQLMEEAEQPADGDAASIDVLLDRQAEAYRNGLMIAFLAARPLRSKNMLNLEINNHFLRSKSGYEVEIPGKLVKNKEDLEFPMPTVLTPYIDRYLNHYRRILAAGAQISGADYAENSAFVWLSRSGARLPTDSFADIVTRLTTMRFEVRLTPHGFRHCVATSIATRRPEDYAIIRLILGHTTIRTSERYYIHASGTEAARRLQQTVAALRTGARDSQSSPADRGAVN